MNSYHILFVTPGTIANRHWTRTTPRPISICTRQPPRACEAKTAPPSKEEVDKLFAGLQHVNQNMRKKASAALSEIATADDITRLLLLLEVEDVHHRRAAVQTLGMTGMAVIPPLITLLQETQDSTVRASCAKALAAVSLYYPEERANFPTPALDALAAALNLADDPVTRLSVVGCLGSLGCDSAGGDGQVFHGCSRAIEILGDVCKASSNMAVAATAVSAMAQIAQNGTKERMVDVMERLKAIIDMEESDDPESALGYVKEIAASHIEQLQGRVKE